jgi:AraC-like DNA-binding protein
MRTPDAGPDLTPGVSVPPYREVVRMPHGLPGRLVRGSLLVLEAESLAHEWLLLPQSIATLRARHPTAPVILRVPETTAGTLRLAHRASRLGVRAVIARDEPLADVLRPLLTHPDDLAGDLVEWLQIRGRMLSPRVSALVRSVVELAPRYAHVGELVRATGESDRTVRHLFQYTGSPGLRHWHQGARALYAALRLQAAETDARGEALARLMGYSDHSGFSRQITRTFGVTPAGIRGTLGWEWLADRWMSRAERTHSPAS